MEYRVVITVGKPPNGRPKIVENTIPAKAPGGDVLAKLASGLKPSRGRSRRKQARRSGR